MPAPRAGDLLAALAARPGAVELLQLSERRGEVALVGGAVRDLLLERTPRELDVVVAQDARGFAAELAARLGGDVSENERFATALVRWPGGRIDVAMRRAESYPAPGALPQVRPGSLEEDLQRRDFTVNAIALALAGAARGELRAAGEALADLDARLLRVLHERSFIDDPTRLLRLARYGARLGFTAEPVTAELARGALAGGALASVSGARAGAELRLALAERDAPGALEAMDELGVLGALHPRLAFDARLAADSLELLARSPRAPGERSRALLLLAVLVASLATEPGAGTPGAGEAHALLGALEFPAQMRDGAIQAAGSSEELAGRLAGARTRSQVYEACAGASAEAVALAGARGARRGERAGNAAAGAAEWLEELGSIALLISGEDLLAAGVPQGPEIRRRLDAALRRKLDGELEPGGREAELRAALEVEP